MLNDAPAFRTWPPIALGGPWLAGACGTAILGDPIALDGIWSRATGGVLIVAFVVWNGWCLLLMGRHETALLPGGATTRILDSGPFGVSRNPLYVGLTSLALGSALIWPSFWALVSVPVGFALLWWGAVIPEERYLAAKFGLTYGDYCSRVRRWL